MFVCVLLLLVTYITVLILKLVLVCYKYISDPKGNFEGNQLLDGSMSLSPLYIN